MKLTSEEQRGRVELLIACCDSCEDSFEFDELVAEAILRSKHSLEISEEEYVKLKELVEQFGKTLRENPTHVDLTRLDSYNRMCNLIQYGPATISRETAKAIYKDLGVTHP